MMAVLSVVCSEAQAADRRTKQAAKNCFFMDVWLNGKHGKIDPVGTDEIDPVKTA